MVKEQEEKNFLAPWYIMLSKYISQNNKQDQKKQLRVFPTEKFLDALEYPEYMCDFIQILYQKLIYDSES